jgi:hypothetical protein
MGVLSHKNVCGGAIHFVQLLRGPCSRKTENGMHTRSPRPLNLTCRGISLSSFPPPTRCHTPWQIPCQSGRIILCNSMVPSPCLSAFPGRPLAFKLDSKHGKQQTHHHNWQLIVILLPHTDPSLSPLHDFGFPRVVCPYVVHHRSHTKSPLYSVTTLATHTLALYVTSFVHYLFCRIYIVEADR